MTFTVAHIDECDGPMWPRFFDEVVGDPLAAELVIDGSLNQITDTPQDAKAWKLSDHGSIGMRILTDYPSALSERSRNHAKDT